MTGKSKSRETHQVRNLATNTVCHLGDHSSCAQYIANVVWLGVGYGRADFSIETKGMK